MLVLKDYIVNGEDIEFGYAIDADEFNIILYKIYPVMKGKKVGELGKQALGYFTSIQQALQKIYQFEVGLQGLDDLEALDKRITSVMDTCVKSLGDFNTVRGKI